MAQLSELPNELLRHILGHVMPEDLENFAQTSKHVQLVSRSELESHRQLIRKYTSVSDLAYRSYGRIVNSLLKDILSNPRIGHYVKILELYGESLEDLYDGEDLDDESQDEQDSEPEDGKAKGKVDNSGKEPILDQIHAAVNENKLLNPHHLQSVHEDIDIGKKHILIALLLSLLPNLTMLSMEDQKDDQNHLSEFCTMLERAPRLDARFLGKLEHVHIKRHLAWPIQFAFPLDRVTNLPLLPSLRKFSCLGPYLYEWKRELLEPLKPSRISNVTDLELRESFIDSKFLDQFLKHFPHLQIFFYTHSNDRNFDNDNDLFDPFITRTALEARVPTTLRRLTILTDRWKDKKTFMGPLYDFKVLEYVHSEWGCLIPDIPSDDRESLSLILPKSLKVINIRDHDDYYVFNHKELIDHAIQAKMGRNVSLPLLETLIFTMRPESASAAQKELCDGADQELQQRCDEVGLSLRFNVE